MHTMPAPDQLHAVCVVPCFVSQHVHETVDSLTAAASSQPDAEADADDAVGLIPMPVKVLKTEKLIGSLRTPQVCADLIPQHTCVQPPCCQQAVQAVQL